MPKPSKIEKEKAIAIVRQFLQNEHFITDDFPGPRADVWTEMSKILNGIWNPRDCYREVTEDRRKILSIARDLEKISLNKSLGDEVAFDSFNDSRNNSAIINSVDELSDWEASGLETYQLQISENLWNELREAEQVQYGNRKYSILRRGGWTDTLAEAFFALTQMPCAFVFKNAKLYEQESSIHHLTIMGKCMSKCCGNVFRAYMDRKPEKFPCTLRVRTRDTFLQLTEHEDVQRPARHLKRLRIGEAAFKEGAANYRKREAASYASTCTRLPAHLPKLGVIRQCKSDYTQHIYGVKPEDHQDVVFTVEKMRHDPEYPQFIHDVQREPFFVAYSTPEQLHCYKRFNRLCRDSCNISIDGTGSIVQSIVNPISGVRTGHIFLYTIVINYLGTILPVHQALLESQSTNVLLAWIKKWLTLLKAPKPLRARSDCSRALMNAMSLGFNDQTIKTYIDTMFLRAMKSPLDKARPPIFTFIQLDVAHFMKKICRWDCVKNISLRQVRRFYLFCVALLIDCQDLSQFEEVLQLICTMALSEYQDSMTECHRTALESQKKLESIIACRENLDNIVGPEDSDSIDDTLVKEETLEESCNDPSIYYPVKEWITNVRAKSEAITTKGRVSNAFYAPKFLDRFMNDLYEFPLWSAACLPSREDHATTACSEAYFNEKKNRGVGRSNGRSRVDLFLKMEHKDCNGITATFQDKWGRDGAQKYQNKKKTINTEPTITPEDMPPQDHLASALKKDDLSSPRSGKYDSMFDLDTISTDNWRNKGKIQANDLDISVQDSMSSTTVEECENPSIQESSIPIVFHPTGHSKGTKNIIKNESSSQRRESMGNHSVPVTIKKESSKKRTYFNQQPDIAYENLHLGGKKKAVVLLNGNMRSAIPINGIHYIVLNTCPFDTIIQILTTSGMDDSTYEAYIDVSSSSSPAMKFVQNFMKKGVCADTYRERTRLMINTFADKIQVPNNNTKADKLYPHTLDMYTATADVWTKCFESTPSGYNSFNCDKCGLYSTVQSTVWLELKIIWEHGFKNLQDAIPSGWKSTRCIKCHSQCTQRYIYNNHLFIEAEAQRPNEPPKKHKLRDFPITMTLNCCIYRLRGVIGYQPGTARNSHFVAYCHRSRWEEHNDLLSSINTVQSSKQIIPNAAIYIRVDGNSTQSKHNHNGGEDQPTENPNPKKQKKLSLISED